MNLSIKNKFGNNSLSEIISIFSDMISFSDYNVEIEYRAERNRKGKFKGVCLKKWMWLTPNDSKDKIIDYLVNKTKLNKDIVIEKYSELIDNKFYGLPIATYIIGNSGYTDDNIFHNNIYNCDLFQQIHHSEHNLSYNSYSDRIDKILSLNLEPDDNFIFKKNKEIKENFHGDGFSRFYHNDGVNKNLFFIYDKKYEINEHPIFKIKYDYKNGFKNKNSIDIFQKIINIGKINLNIFDHTGKIHKYVTYHRVF